VLFLSVDSEQNLLLFFVAVVVFVVVAVRVGFFK
jgi:hypothetical protein